MCLDCATPTDLQSVSAFKVFGQDREGRLTSCFLGAKKSGQFYPPNQRITVDSQEASFFAFDAMESAVRIVRAGKMEWRFVDGSLLILPVTLYGTIHKGNFYVPSRDIQCMDGYYPAFTATEIEVHDSPDNRRVFCRELIKHDLKQRVLWNKSLKAAYQAVFLELFPGCQLEF